MTSREQRGRGRLSSIEMLPPECHDTIQWANIQLKERRRTQADIHVEFNERLADLDCGPISKSSFTRHSIKKAAVFTRMERTTEITAALAETRTPEDVDDLTIMVTELIKTLVFEMLEKAGEGGFTPKQAMEMARAIQASVQAQSASAKRRAALRAEMTTAVTEAIEKVGQETGLSADRIAQIRREVLGIPEPDPVPEGA